MGIVQIRQAGPSQPKGREGGGKREVGGEHQNSQALKTQPRGHTHRPSKHPEPGGQQS